jgi:hypothetical protein
MGAVPSIHGQRGELGCAAVQRRKEESDMRGSTGG